jgi:hypothetical protein
MSSVPYERSPGRHESWCQCIYCLKQRKLLSAGNAIRRHPEGKLSRNPSPTIGTDETLTLLARIFTRRHENDL